MGHSWDGLSWLVAKGHAACCHVTYPLGWLQIQISLISYNVQMLPFLLICWSPWIPINQLLITEEKNGSRLIFRCLLRSSVHTLKNMFAGSLSSRVLSAQHISVLIFWITILRILKMFINFVWFCVMMLEDGLPLHICEVQDRPLL